MPPFDAASSPKPKPTKSDFHNPWGDSSQERSKLKWVVWFFVVFGFHALLLVGAKEIKEKKTQQRVEMAIYEPPPPPPPPPPEPPQEKAKPKKKKRKPKLKKPPPPPPNQPPPTEPPAAPPPIVTGISMASTVKGSGMAVRVGNTTMGDPNKEKFVDPSKVKPYQWSPVRSGKLSRKARVKKEFMAPYPPQAEEAEIEGTVVLRIQVTRKGKVRNAKVIRKLGFGLDEAALAAIKKFKFDPAIVDDEPVDSIIVYKYKFELVD